MGIDKYDLDKLREVILDVLTDDRNWDRGYGGDYLKDHQCVDQIMAAVSPLVKASPASTHSDERESLPNRTNKAVLDTAAAKPKQ